MRVSSHFCRVTSRLLSKTNAEASQVPTGDGSRDVGATRSATSPMAMATTYRIGAGAITPALSEEGLVDIGMADRANLKWTRQKGALQYITMVKSCRRSGNQFEPGPLSVNRTRFAAASTFSIALPIWHLHRYCLPSKVSTKAGIAHSAPFLHVRSVLAYATRHSKGNVTHTKPRKFRECGGSVFSRSHMRQMRSHR